ncbi:MAG: hypothetical protein K5795_03125 [Lachnospiraceae bacterium]|nr:hypothetical protein [Lachnospiraceae bacterium]
MFNSKRKKTPNGIKSLKRIGILGLGPRSGTTHIAVTISNFLNDEAGLKAALCEQNPSGDLGTFILSLGAGKAESIYTYHRVTYIPCDSVQQVFDTSCDCMVYDLGHNFSNALNTLKYCDIRIIVGMDAPWRRNEYRILEELAANGTDISNWRLFVNLGNIKYLEEKAKYGMITGCFPFEPDPVYPCRETIDFLMEALS